MQRIGIALTLASILSTAACRTSSSDAEQRVDQCVFESPEAAAAALVAAVEREDDAEIWRIFGPRTEELKTGNEALDRRAGQLFVRAYEAGHRIGEGSDGSAVVMIGGAEAWPFSVPLVREGELWHFDTDAGIDELANRRVGFNELRAILACHALFRAQLEYHSVDRDGDGVQEYARRLISTPGQKDGLYWPAPGGVDPSPIGPALAHAAARRDEDDQPLSFYGYYYKPLRGQGPSAPGGALTYAQDGELTRGWAVLAYPSEYGETGVMSFLVGSEGEIYERDLGSDTAGAIESIDAYDPGAGWRRVQP